MSRRVPLVSCYTLYHSTFSFLFRHFLAEFQGFDYDQRTQPGLAFLDVLTSDVYLEST